MEIRSSYTCRKTKAVVEREAKDDCRVELGVIIISPSSLAHCATMHSHVCTRDANVCVQEEAGNTTDTTDTTED